MWSKNVSVYPWVGEKYSNPINFKSKTLFLGESNYTKLKKFAPELVINCVIDDISPDSVERDTTGFCKFSTKIRRTVFGPDETVGPYGFWQDVAFCNFVQFLVGEEARKRPANEMWRDSVPAFEEIVSSLQPDKMIVLGKANWKNLLDHLDCEALDDFSARIKLNSKVFDAGYINHPSSRFSYKGGPLSFRSSCGVNLLAGFFLLPGALKYLMKVFPNEIYLFLLRARIFFRYQWLLFLFSIKKSYLHASEFGRLYLQILRTRILWGDWRDLFCKFPWQTLLYRQAFGQVCLQILRP